MAWHRGRGGHPFAAGTGAQQGCQ